MSTVSKIAISDLLVIDKSRLVGEFGEDPEILAELRDLFLAHIPPLLDEICAAFSAGDASRVSKAAHSMKGASNTYGACRLAEVARIVEVESKEKGLADLATDVSALAEELARVTEAIRTL